MPATRFGGKEDLGKLYLYTCLLPYFPAMRIG